jgi:hypothetical protein
MDWDRVRIPATAKRTPAPQLDRLRVMWRVKATTSERVWECVLYRVATGLELRVQPEGVEDPIPAMTQLVAEEHVDILSHAWRIAAVAKGFANLAPREDA